MYRFLLTRRWLAFALFVVVLAGACIWLGMWQFGRLDDRVSRNEVTRHNMVADPVPVTEVATTDIDTAERNEWRQVEVTGTYDVAGQVVVKYQTRDDGPGVEIVTPLRTADGRGVLVDRGWMPSQNRTGADLDIPEPPSGQVTVVGWWRADDNVPLRAVQPDDGQVRAISTLGMGPALDYPLYDGGYLALETQEPAADGLVTPSGPDLGQGPHLFYGIQWWFFAALAIGGYGWFAWSEAHPRTKAPNKTRPGQRATPRPAAAVAAARRAAQRRAAGQAAAPDPAHTSSEPPLEAAVDREHHAGDVRGGG